MHLLTKNLKIGEEPPSTKKTKLQRKLDEKGKD
jgi:hypothetical protein